jgi:16S rRNA (adenine1518-N6/adenine1519-N6)-dimethyltransferase
MTSTPDQSSVLPTTRRGWQDLLSHLDIRPSKGMGQNFLFDRDIVRRIVDVAGVDQNSVVVEVGPGLGIMTEELLARAGQVIAVELDRRLAAHLRHLFENRANFTLVERDALKADYGDLVPAPSEYKLVANLPYSVASAITRHALEASRPPATLTLMVQKEVAERMAAVPPDMSILSVATQFYAEAEITFIVPPEVFVPRPNVESAVVRLETRGALPLTPNEIKSFFRVVNAGFRQKRKQVANSLSAELKLPKLTIQEVLQNTGLDPMRRAETFSVDEWVRLSIAFRDVGAP